MAIRRPLWKLNYLKPFEGLQMNLIIAIATQLLWMTWSALKRLNKWVSHDLNDRQKIFPFGGLFYFTFLPDPFLDRSVICDGKWILVSQWKRSGQFLDKAESPSTFQSLKFIQKTMVTGRFPAAGVIHYNFLKTGPTITAENYYQEMCEWSEKFLIKSNSWRVETEEFIFDNR